MNSDEAHPGGITFTGIKAVLLDIEGTTCPVSFVAVTLFPYASEAMAGFLDSEAGRNDGVRTLLKAVEEAWRHDADPAARQLRENDPADLVAYLRWLIQVDRKLPALKELQGLIWQQGYDSGELVSPLFDDVAGTLRRWRRQGLRLAVYSSGSVQAQQLLYRHTAEGDLSGLFEGWFDTRTGPKKESSSYGKIAKALALETQAILFISDSVSECTAAQYAGLKTAFSLRPGNPEYDPGTSPKITSLDEISLSGVD